MQRQGRLPWVTSDQDQRILSLSKYGIKVTDENRQRVYARHALHFIINITYYEDTYCKHMIAIRVGRPNVATFDLYVYECTNEVSGCTSPCSQVTSSAQLAFVDCSTESSSWERD